MAVVLSLLTLALAVVSNGNPLSTHVDDQALRRPYPFVLAPLITPDTPAHRLVNNSYIVVLKQGLARVQVLAHMNDVHSNLLSSDLLFQRDGGLNGILNMPGLQGYSGSFTEDTIHALRAHPEVDFIEREQMFHTMDYDAQKNAPWGLARISHRSKLGLSNFKKYEYDNDGGEGVNVYVIDTGIFVDHEEFEGRASWGKTMPKNDVDEDGNGHGTHCAGTIASRKYGVAKKANVIAVKVLGSNGSGSTSDVAGGIEWAYNDALQKKKAALAELKATGKTKHKGSVANMSLGGGKSTVLDRAVNAAVTGGVHFAVAAGNENADACNGSPSGASLPVTVGASTLGDERAYFSNHGECVDVFAPGLNILSTWNGPRNDSVNTISGTSMASPHTAGLMAYLLSLYPSDSFNPPIAKPKAEVTSKSSYNALLTLTKATLPSWMTYLLPTPEETEFAPIPDPFSLTPDLMKQAVVLLSTRGVLSDLPPKTVNLLIYNNITALAVAKEKSFWINLQG